MVRSKAPAKKQQKKGIDFKKIKRKLGRKLPPPKNATNTEIKSKAIILPEQIVGAEESGESTSKKGLPLKELLQQTSHHNAKVRKETLHVLKNFFNNHLSELQLHKYVIIQKLRERISDDDKFVRDTFYSLFENVIFPGLKEGNKGPMVSSLLMPYVFSAMVNSAIDVRLMAFRFFHLVVEYYPPTFSSYADKILENYKDIIQKNQFYVQDKSKLKVALSGLAHCLSLLPSDENDAKSQKKVPLQNEPLLAYEEDDAKESVGFANLSGRLKEIVGVLISCFQDFIPLIHAPRGFDEHSFGCIHHILSSIRYAIKFDIRKHSQRQTIWLPASEVVTPMILDQDIAPMLLKKLLGSFPLNPENNLSGKGDERYFILNSVLTEIFLVVNEWSNLPIELCNRFLEFIVNALTGKITRIKKSVQENTLLALLPFVPKLIFKVDQDWKDTLLKAFSVTFDVCKPESQLKLACLSFVRDIIIPNGDVRESDITVKKYQSAWVDKLSSLLNQLGDKHPISSHAVLKLVLDLGRFACLNASPKFAEDIINFFRPSQEEGDMSGGIFASLPREAQDLALSFLYYFTMDNYSSSLQNAIASCCIYSELEPAVLSRTVEVLHSAYRDGYIPMTDHFSFLITLIARFKVFPEKLAVECSEREAYCGKFKELTKLVCARLSGCGTNSLVLQILENFLLEQIMLKPALDNECAILRVISELDSKPTILSESSINALSDFLPGYLIEIVECIPEDKENSYLYILTCRYYLVPCYLLFDRSFKLTEQVLRRMQSMVSENTKALESVQDRESGRNSLTLIQRIVSVILLMHNHDKVRKIISPFKSEIDLILQNVVSLQSSGSTSLTVEGKHMMKIAGERLKIASNSLLS